MARFGGLFGKKRQRRVAILGCGPSGMFAAHAFVSNGWDVTIYSKKRRSWMYGAQYLHSPIPGLPEQRITVDYQLRGTADGYRDKVYGPNTNIKVSPESLVGQHPAWDIRAAYHEAYDRYHGITVNAAITPEFFRSEFDNPDSAGYWDLVVSTVPAKLLCTNPLHEFLSQKVWAAGDAPDRQQYSPVSVAPSTVVCNGDPEIAWYRCSNVFDHVTCEWPEDRKPPISGVAAVEKPVSTNCDCRPGIVRLGRYGAWQKGILVDEVYVRASKLASKEN